MSYIDMKYFSSYPSIMMLMFSALFISFWFLNKDHPCILWLSSSLALSGVITLIIIVNPQAISFKKEIDFLGFIIYALMIQAILVRFRTSKKFSETLFIGVIGWIINFIITDKIINIEPNHMSISNIALTFYAIYELMTHKSSHLFDRAIKNIHLPISLCLLTFISIVNVINQKSTISIDSITIASIISSTLSFIMVSCCMQDGINSMRLLSITDPLTGALNKRSFMEVEKNINIEKENGASLFICDIDKFKIINDTYGHDVGDKVIKKLSEIIMKTKRSQDMFFRIGGEEFVVILYPVSKAQSIDIIEMIRKKMKMDNFEPKFTASFGLVMLKNNNINEALKKADTLLYEAKRSGRDMVKH